MFLGNKDLVIQRHRIISQKNQILIIKPWYFNPNIQELIRISDLKFITVNLHMCFKKLPFWPIICRHLAPNMPNRALHMAWVFVKAGFYYTSHSDKYQRTYINTGRYLSSQWIILWKQCAFLTSKWNITLLIYMHSSFQFWSWCLIYRIFAEVQSDMIFN
jgi:hypothetical protein